MLCVPTLSLIWLIVVFVNIDGFIPHPSVRLGARAGDSITHTEITQLAFIRTLARFLFETKAISNYDHNEEYTIDQLYQLTYPTWDTEKIEIETYPLKSILDTILAENALVDFDHWTKKLSAAHFDSEAFTNASRRIIKIRRIIVENVLNKTKDFKQTRQLLGQLLHTLQDFYSHSNWIELGKKDINERLGLYKDIGPIAAKNQSTCTNQGCTKMEVKCVGNIFSQMIYLFVCLSKESFTKITLNKCPLIYYECQNNIRSEILDQGILTSGYSVNQHNEDNEPITKPTDVEKCSHGSVLDTSSHLPAIGGINKDTITPIYSPHFYLHYQAATLAVLATERFFNDLRKELGDENFDRLFAIHPTTEDSHSVSKGIAHLRNFQFFTPSISSGFNIGLHLFRNIKQTAKARWNKIKWMVHHEKSNEIPIEDISFRRKRAFNL